MAIGSTNKYSVIKRKKSEKPLNDKQESKVQFFKRKCIKNEAEEKKKKTDVRHAASAQEETVKYKKRNCNKIISHG